MNSLDKLVLLAEIRDMQERSLSYAERRLMFELRCKNKGKDIKKVAK